MTATLQSISQQIKNDQLDKATEALATSQETEENRAELQFLKGYLMEAGGDRIGAMDCYFEALESDPHHQDAAFRLANISDQYGDDNAAFNYYQECIGGEKVSIQVLLNMAIMFEDRWRLSEAEKCIRAVLEADPNNWRARHFLKSVESSYTMVYDERRAMEREKQSATLEQPISDFELSVRSRNCLRQMGVHTLNDLLRTTEAELLTYKNFGETSLCEIKNLLDNQHLQLGQTTRGEPSAMVQSPAPAPAAPAANAVENMSRSVSDMELSVRSRKCLQWMGIATMGELAEKTEHELISIQNFGQTSLNEIKTQLERFGLSFRAS